MHKSEREREIESRSADAHHDDRVDRHRCNHEKQIDISGVRIVIQTTGADGATVTRDNEQRVEIRDRELTGSALRFKAGA
jgi:hypothetical protein